MIAHGGGGRLTRQLIDRMFLPLFENIFLSQGHDGALLPAIDGEIAAENETLVANEAFPCPQCGASQTWVYRLSAVPSR